MLVAYSLRLIDWLSLCAFRCVAIIAILLRKYGRTQRAAL